MVNLIILIGILIATYVFGKTILAKFGQNGLNIVEGYVISTVIGFGFLALFIFLIGSNGYVSYTTTITTLILMLCISVPHLVKKRKNVKSYRSRIHKVYNPVNKIEIFIIATFTLLIIFNFFRNSLPPIDHDSIETYLYLPKLYLMQGEIFSIDTTYWDNTPQYAQMLSLVGLSLKSIYLPQLITGWASGVFVALLVFLLAKELKFSNRISLLAMVIFYASPTLIWINATNKLDLVWTMFDLSAILFSFKIINGKDSSVNVKSIILIGIFLGFGFGTKFQSILTFTMISLLLLFYNYFKTSHISNLIKFKNITTTIAVLALSMVAISSPNLIRNYYLHGNPVYPIFETLKIFGMAITPSYDYLKPFKEFLSYFIGKNYFLSNNIVFNAQPFGGIILSLIPFTFFDYTKRKTSILLLILFLYYAVGMIIIGPAYPRHIFPSLAFLSILASTAFFYLINKYQKFKYIILISIMMSFVFHLEPKIKSFISNDLQFVLGNEKEEEYLNRVLYADVAHMDKIILNHINTQTDTSDRVLLLYYSRAFYINRLTVDNLYLPEPFVFSETDPNVLVAMLLKNKISYVWYNKNAYQARYEREPWLRNRIASTLLTSEEFQNQYLELICSTHDEYLFKLKTVKKFE